MQKKIILRNKTMAYSRQVKHKLYQWYLTFEEPVSLTSATLTCSQPFDDNGGNMPTRWSPVGTWYYVDLKKGITDKLFIDFGQDWYVLGMLPVLEEAKLLIIKEAYNGNDI